MPRIILIRHGQASFGAADYDQLSVTGREQAQVVASYLRSAEPRINVVLSGVMNRQRDTAAPTASTLGLEVRHDARWNEYDANEILEHHSSSPLRQDGQAGGDPPKVSSEEFQPVLEGAIAEWIAAGSGSPCAESWPSFNGRVRSALLEVAESLGSGETAAVFTSGGVIGTVCSNLTGGEGETFRILNRMAVNGGITRVIYGRSGANLLSFNEQAHLLGANPPLVTFR